MKVLVTGHLGYIGSVLIEMLLERGHEPIGLDTDLYQGCDFAAAGPMALIPTISQDLRDVEAELLRGFDSVIHLAALSNDPVGDLAPAHTFAINLDASVRLALLAREAGVSRFIYSSSCSIYGAAGDAVLDESAPFSPVTPYGESKVRVEEALDRISGMCVTSLRNATAYGVSPRLRMDLVLNELVAAAVETGEILIKSDGTPWRPLVHIRDIAKAFIEVLEAPAKQVAGRAFNVGRTSENFQVRELADMVAVQVPGAVVRYLDGGGPDKRSYRVTFERLPSTVPTFRPEWTVEQGIAELLGAFQRSFEPILGNPKYIRLQTIKTGIEAGRLDESLRPRPLAIVETVQ